MTFIHSGTYYRRYSSPGNVNSRPEVVVAVVYPVRTKALGMGLGASLHKYQHVAYELPCTGPTVVSAVAILIRVCHDCLVFCGARVFEKFRFQSKRLCILVLTVKNKRRNVPLYVAMLNTKRGVCVRHL